MLKGPLKIGIIGCGTIGSEIAIACQGILKDKVRLFAICDSDETKIEALVKKLEVKPAVMSQDAIIKRCGLVVEAASAKISGDILEKCIKAKRDSMIMSVGGLVGREKLLVLARARGIRVYIPSGAMCGVDGLKSASVGRIDSVTLTTSKPPRGLVGAPYLKERGIDVLSITGESVLFEGTAEEAIAGFPQNINVSAVLSIAGLGAKRTRVKIVTSPDYTANVHTLEIEGECGRITTKTVNVPSKSNPKTSELAVFSAIATLAGMQDSVRVGT